MIMEFLDPDVIMGELAHDSPVWIIFDPGKNTAIAHDQTGSGKHLVVMFLREGDAEQFSLIVNRTKPADSKVAVRAVPLHTFIKEVIESGDNVGLVGPTNARQFFDNFPDLLPEYYK